MGMGMDDSMTAMDERHQLMQKETMMVMAPDHEMPSNPALSGMRKMDIAMRFPLPWKLRAVAAT